MDQALAPVLHAVLERAELVSGETVLDIGCGTGASTIAAAGLIGGGGRVIGLDISRPMLTRAEERARAAGLAHARFILGDAQTERFAEATCDAMISRFGVMFFADPVAAFANMARSLRPGGRLVFAAWAAMPKNPWFSIGVNAAIAQVGKPAPVPPGTAGPMAFQDIGMVSGILADAGLTGIRAEEVPVSLTPAGSPAEAALLIGRFGPALRILRERGGTAADAEAVEAAIAGAIAGFDGPDGVRIPSVINLFQATHP